MSKILCLGGAGYIGSVLVPCLLASGHEVTVLDNFMYGQASLNHICMHHNFHISRGDIREPSTMIPLMREAEVIIPLAAYVGAPLCDKDPIGAKTINYDAVLMMLKNASKEQHIIMPTTNSAYGTSDNICTEESPLKPISTYAQHKMQIEERLMQHENAISLRLATVFGMSPRMRIDLLMNDLTYRAVNDRAVILFESHFKRNFVHVMDVAGAFIHTIDKFDKMKGQVYNFGLSAANLSKKELCERIKLQLPEFTFLDAPIGTDIDQRNYVVSNAKIEATGFKATISLEEGIKELIKGFKMLRNTRYGNI
jgi:nucleoside-diphosphate-sugar epimerase